MALPEDKPVFEGSFIRVFAERGWEWVERHNSNGAVAVIAITDQDEILLVKQWRVPLNKISIEIPAGIAGDSAEVAGEAMISAAKRELLEEAGYAAGKWEMLCEGASSPGLSDEVITLFLATDLTKVGEGGGVDNENITVHALPIAKAEYWIREQVAAGCSADVKTYLAVARAKLYLHERRGE